MMSCCFKCCFLWTHPSAWKLAQFCNRPWQTRGLFHWSTYLGAGVVADHGGLAEGIGEGQLDVEQLVAEEIEGEADLGVALGDAVDGVEDAADDKHLAGALVVERYVPHVLDVERVGVELGHGRVVVGLQAVDDPQARLVDGKVQVALRLRVHEDVARARGVRQRRHRVALAGQLVADHARLLLLVVVQRTVVHHVQVALRSSKRKRNRALDNPT